MRHMHWDDVESKEIVCEKFTFWVEFLWFLFFFLLALNHLNPQNLRKSKILISQTDKQSRESLILSFTANTRIFVAVCACVCACGCVLCLLGLAFNFVRRLPVDILAATSLSYVSFEVFILRISSLCIIYRSKCSSLLVDSGDFTLAKIKVDFPIYY